MLKKRRKILFAGGGTIGPVSPLLAVLDRLKSNHPDLVYHWIGTKKGPEKDLLNRYLIGYSALPVAKFDRFFSLRNFILPFLFLLACSRAYRILKQEKPDLIVAAGGFVAVPPVIIGRLMKIPALIHQLDVRPGLANKIMAPFARRITVTFKKSLKDFSGKKTSWSGAPVRAQILNPPTNKFTFRDDKPVALIFGGGTGAAAINKLVWGSLRELAQNFQVIHITGRGKGAEISNQDYFQFEFVREEMGELYHKADIVVTRAGLGTFLELAALKKPAVIIPIPESHQEDNAQLLKDANAALVLDQEKLSPQIFAGTLVNLWRNKEKMLTLSANIGDFYIPDAVERIIEKIRDILYDKDSHNI